MKKKLLLIGGTGFVGSNITSLFFNEYEIKSSGSEIDIRDFDKILDFIASEAPDFVINLASITTLSESYQNPNLTYDINFIGNLNVLRALEKSNFNGRMLYISSGEVYGSPPEHELPLSEDRILKPLSPYAVSKIASEALCYQWSQIGKFDVIIARPFNHFGPNQSDRFAVANFAKQIAKINLGIQKPEIVVGELNMTRDFTDVRDIAIAYILLLENGINGEIYNVCSGSETSIAQILNILLEKAKYPVIVKKDMDLIRKHEKMRSCGNFNKLYNLIGWKPKKLLEESISDTLNYWEAKIALEKKD